MQELKNNVINYEVTGCESEKYFVHFFHKDVFYWKFQIKNNLKDKKMKEIVIQFIFIFGISF